MSTDQIQALTSLPLQALLLIACVTLWRAYNAAQNARIDDLKSGITDLRNRVMMVEDRLGIKPPLVASSLDKDDDNKTTRGF